MRWFNSLEKKFGRFAIPNLIYYVIGLNFVFFLLITFDQSGTVYAFLTLEPALIMQGQLWRLISFIFIPPSFSPLWIIFILYFYYLVGSSLEHEWGSFKFNLYYLVGMIATIAGAFITGGSTGVYLNLSLFLAFAFLFPDFEILLFFILPLKVKYLAILNWVFIAYTVILYPLGTKIAALCSVINFFLFFGPELVGQTKLRRQVHQNRKRFFEEIANTPPIHTCAICGTTEKKEPKMDFAYCRICGDDREYCARHITNHEHIHIKS